MKMVNRKTRKAIRKAVKKVIKKHGAKIAAGLAGGIASTLATLASTEAASTGGKRSNLGEVSKKVTDMIGGGTGERRKRAASVRKVEKREKSGKKRSALTEPVERAL